MKHECHACERLNNMLPADINPCLKNTISLSLSKINIQICLHVCIHDLCMFVHISLFCTARLKKCPVICHTHTHTHTKQPIPEGHGLPRLLTRSPKTSSCGWFRPIFRNMSQHKTLIRPRLGFPVHLKIYVG